MTLNPNINTREFDKFEDVSGLTHVRVKATGVSGTFTPSGLKVAGKITAVVLNSATWTALPASALSARNAIRIQNQSGIEIKINYDNTVATYLGVWVKPNGETYYDISDTISLYAMSASGTPTVIVEEIS